MLCPACNPKIPTPRISVSGYGWESSSSGGLEGVTPKVPGLGGIGRAAIALLALLAATFANLTARAESPGAATVALQLKPADYTILDADGANVIGHTHYSMQHLDDGDLFRGENRYSTGEYDIEQDKIAPTAAGAAPQLLSFEHSFFNADGSPLRVGRADLRSGDAACILYDSGNPQSTSAHLDFPVDTYAGASLVIPIEYRLRLDTTSPINLHAFSCTPDPHLFALEADPSTGTRWPLYSHDLVAVDVRPVLGWWDILLRPFIPSFRAWFDPDDGFSYAGGEIQRYYRGPAVTLLRVVARQTPASSGASAPPPEKQN
jgi:hypothetical protein